MINSLIDNDIILKVCCYEMHAAFAASCADAAISAAVLPIARYVIMAKIKKARHLNAKEGALAAVEELIAAYSIVEPGEEELALAASFEEKAQSLDLELDGGESQLLAILLKRNLDLLITGDKRAILALEHILECENLRPFVACLEQVITTLVRKHGINTIRSLVCAKPDVDKAITNCFSCSTANVTIRGVETGLQSYTTSVRSAASNVLIPSDDLLGAIT